MEKLAPQAFIDAARTNPLLAAEGMDLERAEAVLGGIERIATETESALSLSWKARLFFARYPMGRYIIPIPFVRSFIASERALRRFNAYPSLALAQELVSAWERCARDLSESVERYTLMHHLLFQLERDEARAPIHDMHASITAPEDVDTLLKLLRENAHVLTSHVGGARRLLDGGAHPWPADEAAHHVPTAAGEVREQHQALHELERQNSLPFRKASILESHGPFAYTLPHFDGSPQEHVFMTYIVRDNETGLVSLKISAVDVYLFHDLRNEAENRMFGGALYASLVEAGIPYWYQPSTNLYALRDQTYWADIATSIDLQRRPTLDANRVQRERSSMLDLLLATCLDDHEMNLSNMREIVRRTKKMPRPWRAFLFRSHPSIYYLPFNKSVWRLKKQPNFLGSRRSRPEERLFQRFEELGKTTSDPDITHAMLSGRIREELRTAHMRTKSHTHDT